jgi:hypothetical protein
MEKAKVKENPDLERDLQSNAILNINQENYIAARAAKKRILENIEIRNEITQMKSDINEIKSLLEILIKAK